MFNRAIRTDFVDNLLSAGTMLSLCVFVALGPRPQRIVWETQPSVETVEQTSSVNSILNDASEIIRHPSLENQNP